MKKAFSLFEIILVLFISSIILIYNLKFSKELFEAEIKNREIAIYKIDLNATKIFIERNINSYEKLNLKEQTLYFEENILLEKVNSFEVKKTSNILEISITLDKTIFQIWKFKL